MSDRDTLAVDRELERLLTVSGQRAGTLALSDHHRLWAALGSSTDGGKRFRPALLIATHRALGGTCPEAAARVGAAVELLHTAFVVQDDVIDGDQVRRGAPSVPGAFAQEASRRGASPAGAGRYGDAAGILAGDLGLLTAFRAITRCQAPPEVIEALLDLFETTVHASAAGELADVRLQLGLTEEHSALREALAVAELKTAVYSFRLPLQAGALLAGASEEVLTALEEIGGLLGVGFQLLDDLLGVFGDESRTGKSALGDLREGKRTALLAHARTTEIWPQLQPLVGCAHLQEHDARLARELLTASGSRGWTEDLAHRHLTSAVEAAARHDLPGALVRALSATTEQILTTAEKALLPTDRTSAPAAGERSAPPGAGSPAPATERAGAPYTDAMTARPAGAPTR